MTYGKVSKDGNYQAPPGFSFKERSRMIGGTTSTRRKMAQTYTNSKKAKCKNCKIDCTFREMQLKSDPEAVCIVPNMLAVAKLDGTKVVNLDDNKVKMYMDDLIELYKKYCLEAESNETDPRKIEREKMRRLNTLFHRLKEFKMLWSPPVQKSLNVNVDLFKENLKTWREERLAINEMMGGDKDGTKSNN